MYNYDIIMIQVIMLMIGIILLDEFQTNKIEKSLYFKFK